jgi:hypothetical protein
MMKLGPCENLPQFVLLVLVNALLGVSQGLTWSTTVIMKIDLVGPRSGMTNPNPKDIGVVCDRKDWPFSTSAPRERPISATRPSFAWALAVNKRPHAAASPARGSFCIRAIVAL